MISVEQALAQIFDLLAPVGIETVALADAAGRVLAAPVTAQRTQPPFAASAMDGYALRAADIRTGARLHVMGTSAAGRGFSGAVGPGQAVRIFTGAPVPPGADHVAIQEDVTAQDDTIILGPAPQSATHIRAAGSDFAQGTQFNAPRRLRPADLALLAAMNVPHLPVRRRPVVAILATGDELVMPGETPGPDQIIASNGFGLRAMVQAEGGAARLLPIARDSAAALKAGFALAQGVDLIVTIGGASVGDHDLVAPVARELGADLAFHKVAMRPGKPLMAGRLGDVTLIGLPGNPVSALVCGHVFLLPAIRALLGLGTAPAPTQRASLGIALGPNGPRAHYMRARLTAQGLVPFDSQDSSLLHILSQADALILRPPHDGSRAAGDLVDYLPL